MNECPVCVADHPTGRFTATFGGLTHRSHECGQAASNAGVNMVNISDPRIAGALRAVKRKYEVEGMPSQCPRCLYFVDSDADTCGRCGCWL
jgi:hypothetical protein